MKEVKKLAGQTVLYGLGTIVPRFLNYAILTPLFTYTLENEADYGVIVELYAWMVLLLVVLTYGMETGFFRYSQKAEDEKSVYSTAFLSLLITSAMFVGFVNLFITDVAAFFNYRENHDYIRMFTAIVAIDAVAAIPFARLRKENRPVIFSIIKLANVVITVSLTVFFINIAPELHEKGNGFIILFYRPDYLVGYVFVANLVGSSATLLMLLPVILKIRLRFSWSLWKKMIGYSLPLLIAGMAGTVNDVIDKILLRRIIGEEEGLLVVGQYGAGYKVAVLMSLFVQMFRFAAEPFFFEKAEKSDARDTYAFVMRHFIISALILFLALNLFMPVVRYFVGPIYRESIVIVPIVSFGYLLYGVYLNLSVWYKINDMTRFGAYFTLAGALFTVTINIVFIPLYGYIASAWAHVVCYSVMVILSFAAGRRKYRIDYDIRGFVLYTSVAIGIVVFALYTEWQNNALMLAVNSILFVSFILFAEKRDNTLSLFFKRS